MAYMLWDYFFSDKQEDSTTFNDFLNDMNVVQKKWKPNFIEKCSQCSEDHQNNTT